MKTAAALAFALLSLAIAGALPVAKDCEAPKVLVCHKGKVELCVARESILTTKDELGPCTPGTTSASVSGSTTTTATTTATPSTTTTTTTTTTATTTTTTTTSTTEETTKEFSTDEPSTEETSSTSFSTTSSNYTTPMTEEPTTEELTTEEPTTDDSSSSSSTTTTTTTTSASGSELTSTPTSSCVDGHIYFDAGNGVVAHWRTSSTTDMSCEDVCRPNCGFNTAAATKRGNAVGMACYPEKGNGWNWETVECSSTDNNSNWGSNGETPDPTFSHEFCHVNCACNC